MRRPPRYTRRKRERMLYKFDLLTKLYLLSKDDPRLLGDSLRMQVVSAWSDARSDIKTEIGRMDDFFSTVEEYDAHLRKVYEAARWAMDVRTTDKERERNMEWVCPDGFVDLFRSQFINAPLHYQLKRLSRGESYG